MIRILGVAPYDGMRDLMVTLSQTREDMILDAYTADYMESLKLIQTLDLTDYDAVISRGGTADILRENLPLPVISIPLTQYDILNVIKLAQASGQSFAIVGFPSTVARARQLCELLNYDIPIYTTHNEDEVNARVLQLKQDGFSLVLGDNMIVRATNLYGITSVLITSGSESILQAFDDAIQQTRYIREFKQKQDFYHSALKANHRHLIIYKADGQLLFSDMPASIKSSLQSITRKLLKDVLNNGSVDNLRRINRKNYLIKGTCINKGTNLQIVFEISDAQGKPEEQYPGLSLIEADGPECKEAEIAVRVFYGNMTKYKSEIDSMRNVGQLLITGETGLLKDEIAWYVYSHSNFSDRSMFVIDCEKVNERSLQFLLHNSDSPLYLLNQAIYIRRFELLSDETREQILRIGKEGTLFSGNKLIFSIQESGVNNTFQEAECIRLLLAAGSCSILRISPLRERVHEFPIFITFYLNELTRLGQKQIAGIEPEGINYLQTFDWSCNIRQFQRVLKSLYDITANTYIHTSEVKNVLENEFSAKELSKTGMSGINLYRPLNHIIADIIRELLQQEGMNQTKVASQLGICRTTLWRYLKSGEESSDK